MLKFRDKVPLHSYSGDRFRTMRTNKKHLREDFNHRCAYCNDIDSYAGKETFQVDHFAPKSKFPHLETTYENLMYSCPYCNRSKSDKWISNDASKPIINNEGFDNPTSLSFESHFSRGACGEIIPLDSLGRYMWENLRLMLQRHACLYRMEVMRQRIQRLKKIVNSNKPDRIREEADDLYGELAKRFYEYYSPLIEEEEV